MITLYNFGPFQGLADASPFCLKVDCYMRASGMEFQTLSGANYLRKAPKGKLPFIEDDGLAIGDSSLIIEHLKNKYGDALDSDLDLEQKALAHAFIKMMDENLYWCIVHSRWIGASWPVIKSEFFGDMPLPLRLLIPALARKGVRKSLHLQGLGRHNDNEILDIARADLVSLSDFLGTKDYFLIDRPTMLDVCAFAFLSAMIVPDFRCELNDMARSFDNLAGFVSRMKDRYYPQ